LSTPAPFAWEDWYAAVGGRPIREADVTEYLRRVYDEQEPRFTGDVAPTRRRFASPDEAAQHLKDKSLEFGADIVGICEIEASDVYQGRTCEHRYAIAVGQRMRWREFQVVPSLFTALREQLGLRLEPQSDSVDALVIDHVEPPTPN
jgi:hypothetical protein